MCFYGRSSYVCGNGTIYTLSFKKADKKKSHSVSAANIPEKVTPFQIQHISSDSSNWFQMLLSVGISFLKRVGNALALKLHILSTRTPERKLDFFMKRRFTL